MSNDAIIPPKSESVITKLEPLNSDQPSDQPSSVTWHSGHEQSHGVVSCVAYRRSTGEKIATLPLCDVSELLAHEPDAYVWIGLFEPSAAVLQEVQHEFDLHDLAVEDATRSHQRAKIESYDNVLFVVLRTAQLVKKHVKFGATYLFVGERFLISVRQGASLSYQPVREHCERHPEKMKFGPVYVLYSILDFVVDQFFPITDQLGEQLRHLEKNIFSERFQKKTLHYLYDLKSELIRFRLAISPMQDICSYFIYHDQEEAGLAIPQQSIPYFRDIQDHVLRTLDAVQGLSDMQQVAMDTYLGLVGFSQNEIVKRLASWAAILAVPTLMASFYGMNFKNMPELDWHYGYYILIAVMFAASYGLYRKLRSVHWL